MKSDFRSESLKRNFSIIVFVKNLIIGCSYEKREKKTKKMLERNLEKRDPD